MARLLDKKDTNCKCTFDTIFFIFKDDSLNHIIHMLFIFVSFSENKKINYVLYDQLKYSYQGEGTEVYCSLALEARLELAGSLFRTHMT